MTSTSLLLVLSAVCAVMSYPQFLTAPLPAGIQHQVKHEQALQARTGEAHGAVVANSIQESQLPPNLVNPFYRNPRVASALAKSSWFSDDEEQVFHREADNISRQKIFSILRNAGLARRR